MATTNDLLTQGLARQPHAFLDYQHVDVYFLYSFAWDISRTSWTELCDQLSPNNKRRGKGWITPRLHDRSTHHSNDTLFANYQPNLVSKRRVLERTRLVKQDITLILPTTPNTPHNNTREKRFSFSLRYTIRIFDDGVSTCTFHACMKKRARENAKAMFEKIHALLRLVRNIDYESQDRVNSNTYSKKPIQPTDAYILKPKGRPKSHEDWSLFPQGVTTCRLHDLFRVLLNAPPNWAPENALQIWTDGGVIDTNDSCQDFQTPFILTVAEIGNRSFANFSLHPAQETTREIASIMCKLTLDNRAIQNDFANLSDDYIQRSLPYNNNRKALANYCLDQRLFFSFSKRGAIAITDSLGKIPACFVVPSFLNLLEITRARWHICCILNMQLDDFIDKFHPHVRNKLPETAQTLAFDAHINSLIHLRHSYIRFLRDPAPYLFDGGSVTEVIHRAMEELGIHELSDAIHRKMEILDAIRRDLEDKERQQRRNDFEKELRRIQRAPDDNGNA